MRILFRICISIVSIVGALGLFAPSWAGAVEQRVVTIGTGGATGVYYPVGGAICVLVNKTRKAHGIRCRAQTTAGSAYNINTIRAGGMGFGIAQSDVHANAVEGVGEFNAVGPYPELRSVFSVHPEPFTVVARADSGIKSFSDLKGKRVNVGNPGSGQRATMEVLLAALGWTLSDFSLASELPSFEQPKALCNGEIDAMVLTVGHPSASISDATQACDCVIVDVSGAAVDTLIRDNNYYRNAIIPGGLYRGSDDDIKTFGVGATVVTSSALASDVVYEVVKSVFENFELFKELHPAFARLKKEEMVSDSLSAPLHPGAEKYFREAGLIK